MSARTKTDQQDIAEIILVNLFLIQDVILAVERRKRLRLNIR